MLFFAPIGIKKNPVEIENRCVERAGDHLKSDIFKRLSLPTICDLAGGTLRLGLSHNIAEEFLYGSLISPVGKDASLCHETGIAD